MKSKKTTQQVDYMCQIDHFVITTCLLLISGVFLKKIWLHKLSVIIAILLYLHTGLNPNVSICPSFYDNIFQIVLKGQ